jgi:hypothetical protein
MMNIQNKLIVYFSLILIISCTKDKTERQDHLIQLKWNQAYAEDSFENAVIGLAWAYSHVGAMETNHLYTMPTSSNLITVNTRQLGFTDQAEKLLEELHAYLVESEEFAVHSSIDMGRYIALLIGASEHYYALTEMPLKLEDLLNQYEFLPVQGIVDNSAITTKHRILKFSGQTGLKQLFITEETDPISGEILEIETVDIMPNGQPRFGIFDIAGNRENAAFAVNSEAGKPAKCMWCHESGIQPLFGVQTNFDDYLEYVVLRDTLSYYRNELQGKQNSLTDGVDYSQALEHVQMELLYISFMEPSAERLSHEWNLSVNKVKEMLEGLPTHEHEEFDFLGELYHRGAVQDLAPYQSLQVSSHVREKSATEVNYMTP